MFFFFKQKTAYEMRISDWSSDVCSSDLMDREGITYTIDTLRDLKAQRPGAELFFISGADAVAQILSWRDHDELWDLAHFVAVSRPGHVLSSEERRGGKEWVSTC